MHPTPTSGYSSKLFCPLERRSWATALKPNAILLTLQCPEPNAFCSVAELSSLLSLDSLATFCPNVHAVGYSDKHTASQAHCFSFQSLCFPSVRALLHPSFSTALFSSLTHLVLLHTLLSCDGLLPFLQILWFCTILEICCLLPTLHGVFGKVKQIWKQSGLSYY